MKFTLGVEEEYQVINPETWELCERKEQMIEEANEILDDQFKAEMHMAVVEVGTKICEDIHDARKQVTELRSVLAQVAGKHGLLIGAAGTHPFSKWESQKITDDPRYHGIVDELQDAARSNLIFGLHVHVGIDDRDLTIHIANSIRYFLPHIFALSTNSPFWEGRNTGFKSFRNKVFDKFPRTGIPDYFLNWETYQKYINMLVKTGCIDNAKKIWWDLRAHPFYPTVEIRICDIPLTIDETVAIAAVIQAVVAKLHKLKQQNLTFMNYHRSLINENRWRAARYGIEGHMIDFGKETEVPTADLIHELLEFVDDVVDDLGSREEMATVEKILQEGTGAKRQLKVYEETGDLKKVVQYITEQTVLGINKETVNP